MRTFAILLVVCLIFPFVTNYNAIGEENESIERDKQIKDLKKRKSDLKKDKEILELRRDIAKLEDEVIKLEEPLSRVGIAPGVMYLFCTNFGNGDYISSAYADTNGIHYRQDLNSVTRVFPSFTLFFKSFDQNHPDSRNPIRQSCR